MQSSTEEFKSALELACKSSNAGRIVEGRNRLLKLDKTYLVRNIQESSSVILNLHDYWEFRRLLEVCELIDHRLLIQIAKLGINSADGDVREAATDFVAKINNAENT